MITGTPPPPPLIPSGHSITHLCVHDYKAVQQPMGILKGGHLPLFSFNEFLDFLKKRLHQARKCNKEEAETCYVHTKANFELNLEFHWVKRQNQNLPYEYRYSYLI
jgi:hypothetical protein